MAEGTLLITGGAHDAPLTIANVEAAALEQHRIMAASDEQAETRTIVGCGWPWLDQTVVIVNPETSTPCPADRVGEIWVSGSSVAQGYWNLPELTRQTFQARLANGDNRLFLRTGDLGYLHDELYITGRLKDVIIICGRNHYPQDIELTVQESHPALQSGMGAAFSVEVDGEEQLVVAHEVKHTAYRRLNIKEVIGNIRQAVAQQHDLSIHAVVLLKTGGIPKTSSGKVQRSACRAAFLAGGLNVIDEGVFQHANPEP